MMSSNSTAVNPFASPDQSVVGISDSEFSGSKRPVESYRATSKTRQDGPARPSAAVVVTSLRSSRQDHVRNRYLNNLHSPSSLRLTSQYLAQRSSAYAVHQRNTDSPTSLQESSHSQTHLQATPNTRVVYYDPDFSPFGGFPISSFPLSMDEKEPDDYMHNPDPVLDAKDSKWTMSDRRGFAGALTLLTMVLGAVGIFIILPVLTFTGKTIRETQTIKVVEVLTANKYPILGAVRSSLVDPDTPLSAYTRLNKDGKKMHLVFSDEFNQEGRTFYPGEDQFWEAVDLNYAATNDLEWYDPDAVTTANGTLVIRMDAFKNRNLNYRSAMLQSWNKLCFKGGALEVSASLPGPAENLGLWPGIWTMGNLGRPGYLATTDGTWPYSYDACDAGITFNQSSSDGISYLPGQRLNSCTCSGEDHPNQGVGRGAPEIDALEGSNGNINESYVTGLASQSVQVAPFDIWYMPNYDFLQIYNHTVTVMNPYAGGPFQQAVSAVTVLNSDWYEGKAYQKYGFEYKPGKGSGYIQWEVGDLPTWMVDGRALGPNGNVATRLISEEPMTIILNFGISNSWTYIDWQAFRFPLTMRIDYVRIYQLANSVSLTCDPRGYPTTDYIKKHPAAYKNNNYTSWTDAGYSWPKNKLVNRCKM